MAKKLFVGPRRKKNVKAPPKTKSASPGLKSGDVVVYQHEGLPVLGVFSKALNEDKGQVELALPGDGGLLFKTGSSIDLDLGALQVHGNLVASPDAMKVKEWSGNAEISTKAPSEVKEGDIIVDYRDVTISGFLSTFVGTTPADRDGDYVMDGAFNDTLEKFRRNPVMLRDHRNSVGYLAGSFSKIGTNQQGLYVEGKVSNAPDEINTRFKIVEGHLKTLSMGGLFRFNREDHFGIESVELYEGSLTPIPANPDAIFQSRALSIVTAAKMMKQFSAIL